MNYRNKLIAINIIFVISFLSITLFGTYKYNQSNKTILIDIKQYIKENDSKKLKTNKILLLIGPFGLSSVTDKFISDIPKEVIIGISPYSSELNSVIDKIKEYSHDIMLNLALEPLNYPTEDPGPYALLNKLPLSENIVKLEFLIDKADSIDGMYSDYNDGFTIDSNNLLLVLKLLKKHKLNYIYGGGNGSIIDISKSIDYKMLVNNILVDKDVNKESIEQQLNNLENISNNGKLAIGFARPYPVTIDVLKNWISSLKDKNIELINLKQAKEYVQ